MALVIAMIGSLTVVALMPDLFAPNEPDRLDLSQRLLPPSGAYPLGTDQFGRCILSRIVFGARATLGASLVVLLATVLVSGTVAAGATLAQRTFRGLLLRLVELCLALPTMVVAIAVVGLLGPGLINGMLAVAVTSWAGPARVLRALLIGETHATYVLAARSIGASPITLLVRHIGLGVAGRSAVIFSTYLGQIILALSSLSFLGLGPQPPTAEWGSMLNEGRPFFLGVPSLMILPGAAIVATVGACNLLADNLNSALDERRC